MGKKYIPVKMNKLDYRIYLDNVEKVYKVNKKNIPKIPPYARKTIFRKNSFET